MTWRLVLCTALLLLLVVPPPAGAADEFELLETITIPANQPDPGVTSKTSLDAGTKYKLVVTGTATMQKLPVTEERPDPPKWSADAVYCFEGECPNGKKAGSYSSGVYFNASPGFFDMGNMDSIAGKTTTSVAYRSDHRYEGTFKGKSGPLRVDDTAGNCCAVYSGGFTVELYGPPKKSCRPVVATIKKIEGGDGTFQTRVQGGSFENAKVGDKICAGGEVVTDPDGTATIEFSDGSMLEIRPMSQIKVNSLVSSGDAIKTEILLRVGEIVAEVKRKPAIKSDLSIRSPTATASTRGTKWTMSYDPISKSTLVSVTESEVEVDPVKAGLATTVVGAGKEVEVSLKKVSAIAPIGKAGTPKGGLPRAKARARVAKILAKANGPCKLTVKSFGLKAAKKGWLASAKVSGKAKGTASWSVIGKKVKAKNAVAKKLGRNCR